MLDKNLLRYNDEAANYMLNSLKDIYPNDHNSQLILDTHRIIFQVWNNPEKVDTQELERIRGKINMLLTNK